MKKIYNTPIAEFVELKLNPVMNNMSLPEEGRGDAEDQGTGGYRGDWENIWGNM